MGDDACATSGLWVDPLLPVAVGAHPQGVDVELVFVVVQLAGLLQAALQETLQLGSHLLWVEVELVDGALDRVATHKAVDDRRLLGGRLDPVALQVDRGLQRFDLLRRQAELVRFARVGVTQNLVVFEEPMLGDIQVKEFSLERADILLCRDLLGASLFHVFFLQRLVCCWRDVAAVHLFCVCLLDSGLVVLGHLAKETLVSQRKPAVKLAGHADGRPGRQPGRHGGTPPNEWYYARQYHAGCI